MTSGPITEPLPASSSPMRKEFHRFGVQQHNLATKRIAREIVSVPKKGSNDQINSHQQIKRITKGKEVTSKMAMYNQYLTLRSLTTEEETRWSSDGSLGRTLANLSSQG